MEKFEKNFSKEKLIFNELMKNHTTFEIGGPADLVLLAESITDIVRALSICKDENIPYFVIGNGSNVLVSDKGFKGVIIKLANFTDINISDNIVTVTSGVDIRELSKLAGENVLTGLEFAEGIPATVGGAICMNAGAYGSEIKDVLLSVEVLKNGELTSLLASELEFGYRTSLVKKENLIVVSAKFSLKKGNEEEIKETMQDLNKRRIDKQPLEYPSAGSIFKRPEGYFAGKLIQDAGLVGKQIGGASVSTKHAGFIVNKGNATAEDVLQLIKHIQETVKEKFGVVLEREVIVLE